MANRMRNTHRRGLSTLEMAIVAPLFLFLVFGVIEYSWMFLKASDISSAAREGVRYAVRPAVTETAQLTSAASPLVSVLNQSGIPLASVTVLCPADRNPGVATGSPVTVHVSMPYSAVEIFGIMPTPQTLQATVTMLKEGY